MLEQPFFGQRLRSLRRELGLSQAELAADGMSTGYLSRLESGARPPTSRAVKYLAERLDVSPRMFDHAQDERRGIARTLASVSSADGGDVADELAEALRSDHEAAPALRWQALWQLAGARGAQGRHNDQREALIELAQLSDELALPELRARAYTQLSRCVRVLGDNDKAREYAMEAIALAGPLGLIDRTAALHAVVSAEAESGRLAEARARADELVDLTEAAGGTSFTRALWASATVSLRQGDHAKARADLERALETLSSHEDLTLWMRLRLAAASLYLQITPPETEAAGNRLDEVESAVTLVGTEQNKQELVSLRAHLAFWEERYDDARELCDVLERDEGHLSFRDQFRLQALRGLLRIMDGQMEPGVQELQQLAQQAQDSHNVELAVEIWRNLAQTLAKLRGSAS